MLRAVAHHALGQAKRREQQLTAASRRTRLAAFSARLAVLARWVDATVDLELAPDVALGRRIRLVLWPGSHSIVRVAAGSRIGDGVTLILKGGELDCGLDTDIRAGCVLSVGGLVELAGSNILGYGTTVHCADRISLGAMTSASERVTLTDSSHYFTEPGAFFYHNVRTAPVDIGVNTWLCAGSVVTRGSTVGDHCVISANSVVSGDVPAGHLASGVPAAARRLELPWQGREDVT
jgi:maltose O-acetyltransferase